MGTGDQDSSDPPASPSSAATVDDLRRWVDFGGTWRLERRDEASVTLALCRCDGGEQVDVMVSADPELISLVEQSQGGS